MPKDTKSSEYENLKTEIRAVLISSQQGCTERELIKDYAAFNSNAEIPFRALGYSSLMELLASMPDVARINTSRSPPIIMGVPDENTIHIQEFVSRQKKNKKLTQRRTQYNPQFYPTTQYRQLRPFLIQPTPLFVQQPISRPIYSTPQYSVIAPPAFSQNWSYAIPQGATFNSYNYPVQPLTNAPRLSVDKSVASFPPKSVSSSDPHASRLTPNQDDASSSTTDEDTKQSEDEPWLIYDYKHAETYGDEIIYLRQRIRQLLVKFPNGFWLTSLEKLYKKMFNEDFKLEDFHLKNLLTFFDCISDFVDSKRVKGDEQNRLITLKTNLFDWAKKEQPDPDLATFLAKRKFQDDQQMFGEAEELESMPMANHQPIFVSSDFRYKRAEFRMTGPFKCILGVVEDPLSLTIAPLQFESTRLALMNNLQHHYNQTHDDPSYIVSFDQLKLNLPCVYYHIDRQYYRGFIENIDQKTSDGSRSIRIRLVDFGASIDDINYFPESTFLKYLHQNFASQATEMYECRLANLDLPPGHDQWSPQAKEMIAEFCKTRELFAEMTGLLDSIYCVYLWSDDQLQQSINQILIENNLAVESKDNSYIEFQPLVRHDENSTNLPSNPTEHHYIDPKFLADRPAHQIDYSVQEKSLKHFTISVEHAYYFVKQPFNKQPCLPCFELARLLNIKEEDLHRIDLVSTSEFFYDEAYRDLFEDLYRLQEAIDCPHLHRNNGEIFVQLYDLLGVHAYLKKHNADGDLLDAFKSEYENYSREGYWHEFEAVYMRENDIDSYEKILSDRRNLLKYRREQLLSSSVAPTDSPYIEQIQDVDRRLRDIHQIRHPKSTEFSSSSSPVRSASVMQNKSSKTKLRETLLRLARPFDRHFGLNICFVHQTLDESHLNIDLDELDECLRDLHRITDNVLQFFRLERDTLHPDDRAFFDQLTNILPELIDGDNWQRRIDIYNYCLNIIESCQPVIRGYIQRTDLIDSI